MALGQRLRRLPPGVPAHARSSRTRAPGARTPASCRPATVADATTVEQRAGTADDSRSLGARPPHPTRSSFAGSRPSCVRVTTLCDVSVDVDVVREVDGRLVFGDAVARVAETLSPLGAAARIVA